MFYGAINNKIGNKVVEMNESNILNFYIDNNDNQKILTKNEIKKLYTIYKDIKYDNINKDYI